MNYSIVPLKLTDYEAQFKTLQLLAYKDLIINQLNIRILGIHLMNYGPDWRINEHRHSFYEFHYVTKDYVYTIINQAEYRINPNQFYLMPPGTYHAHRQDPGTQHIGFALRWEFIKLLSTASYDFNVDNQLNEIVLNLQKAPSQPVSDHQLPVLKALGDIFAMIESHYPIIQLQLGLAQLILKIAAFYQKPGLEPNHVTNDAFWEDHIVKNALNFINENFSQPITVEDISHTVHLSYSQLARLFKKYTGHTITNHLNTIRLSRAQLLLKCSTKSISQIAAEVGYNSEYYFCSLFKKFYKQSPRSYRLSQGRLSE